MKKKILVDRTQNNKLVWVNFNRIISQSDESFWRPLRKGSQEYLSALKNEGTAAAIRRIMRLPGVEQITVSTYLLYVEVAEMFSRDKLRPTIIKIICQEILGENPKNVEIVYK